MTYYYPKGFRIHAAILCDRLFSTYGSCCVQRISCRGIHSVALPTNQRIVGYSICNGFIRYNSIDNHGSTVKKVRFLGSIRYEKNHVDTVVGQLPKQQRQSLQHNLNYSTRRPTRHDDEAKYQDIDIRSSTVVEGTVIYEKLNDLLPILEKQSESNELTTEEVELKNALHQLKDYTTNNSNISAADLLHDPYNTQLISLTENVRDCYEKLMYWDYALQTEQQLEVLYSQKTNQDSDRTVVVVTEHNNNDNNNNTSVAYAVARSWFKQGNYNHRMQHFSAAQKLYQKALHFFLDSSTKQEEKEEDEDDDDDEESHYGNNDEPTILHSNSVMAGNLLIYMAGIQFEYEKYNEAIDLLKQSESIFTNGKNDKAVVAAGIGQLPSSFFHIDYVKCLQQLGLLYRTIEDYNAALIQYQKAIIVLETIVQDNNILKQTDTSAVPIPHSTYHSKRQGLLLDISDMYSALEKWDDAIQSYTLVLDEDKVYRRRSNTDTTLMNDNECIDDETALDGAVLHCIGKIHAYQGYTDQAIDELEHAVEIRRKIGGEYNSEVGKTLTILGAVYATKVKDTTTNSNNDNDDDDDTISSGEYKLKALECFQQALLIAKGNSIFPLPENDPDVMLALRNIAILQGDRVPKWGSEDDDDDAKQNNVDDTTTNHERPIIDVAYEQIAKVFSTTTTKK